MDALEAMLTRHTVPPAKMGPPGPGRGRAATYSRGRRCRARSWPAAALALSDRPRRRAWPGWASCSRPSCCGSRPDASPGEVEKQRTAPLRASVIVVVAARVDPAHPKIPEVEQIAAVAAATQNMLLAAHALGFAAKWATGKQAYDPGVKAGLGLAETDRLLGFLYLGSYAAEHALPPRPGLDGVVAEWPPAGVG